MKRSKGTSSKHSRALFSKGRVTVAKLLKTFAPGARARISVNPCFRGAPPLRFNNHMVEVVEKRGNAFEVKIKDGGKEKRLYIKNVHLSSA